jgi:hypothetical protein
MQNIDTAVDISVNDKPTATAMNSILQRFLNPLITTRTFDAGASGIAFHCPLAVEEVDRISNSYRLGDIQSAKGGDQPIRRSSNGKSTKFFFSKN